MREGPLPQVSWIPFLTRKVASCPDPSPSPSLRPCAPAGLCGVGLKERRLPHRPLFLSSPPRCPEAWPSCPPQGGNASCGRCYTGGSPCSSAGERSGLGGGGGNSPQREGRAGLAGGGRASGSVHDQARGSYPEQRVHLKNQRQVNPTPADEARIAREQALMASAWRASPEGLVPSLGFQPAHPRGVSRAPSACAGSSMASPGHPTRAWTSRLRLGSPCALPPRVWCCCG